MFLNLSTATNQVSMCVKGKNRIVDQWAIPQ